MLCAAKHPEHKYVDPMTGQPIDQSILKKVSSDLPHCRRDLALTRGLWMTGVHLLKCDKSESFFRLL